jgi:hypothetical protein
MRGGIGVIGWIARIIEWGLLGATGRSIADSGLGGRVPVMVVRTVVVSGDSPFDADRRLPRVCGRDTR